MYSMEPSLPPPFNVDWQHYLHNMNRHRLGMPRCSDGESTASQRSTDVAARVRLPSWQIGESDEPMWSKPLRKSSKLMQEAVPGSSIFWELDEERRLALQREATNRAGNELIERKQRQVRAVSRLFRFAAHACSCRRARVV